MREGSWEVSVCCTNIIHGICSLGGNKKEKKKMKDINEAEYIPFPVLL